MRGRKPLSLVLAPQDVPILRQIARSQISPWYLVQRARTVLAIAAGQRVHDVAEQMQCGPTTVWRTCRCYERSGLDGLVARGPRPGRPFRISPPPASADRLAGVPGAGGQGFAHHPLV